MIRIPEILSTQELRTSLSEGGGTSSLGSLSELFIVPALLCL